MAENTVEVSGVSMASISEAIAVIEATGKVITNGTVTNGAETSAQLVLLDENAHTDGAGESSLVSVDQKDITKERRRSRKHSKRDSQVVKLPDIIAPQSHPDWVRYFDPQQNIYYVHTKTGASAWLLPCCQCQEAGERWCITCKRSYCERDFRKRHGKSASREKHKWQFKELQDVVALPPGEEYCVACVRKAAFKMCMECWEPYCLTCFGLVHHVGALKLHKSMPYKRVKAGWVCVKDYTNNTEKFVHGETGETVTERPLELYTEGEKIMLENINVHKAALDEHVALIDKLKAELEVVHAEKDRAIVETCRAMNEMRARMAERENSGLGSDKKPGGNAKSKHL